MLAAIKKFDLDAFIIQASNIKTNEIYPILKNIKIEISGDTAKLYKSNNKSFVIRTIENDSLDGTFLVNEAKLANFLSYSKDEYIKFEVEDNRIKVSDKRAFIDLPAERAIEFPRFEVSELTWSPISKDIMSSIGVCSQLIFNGQLDDPKSSVFIGNGAVTGTDGSIGFLQKHKGQFPKIVLRREVASIVSRMSECDYAQDKHYDYFKGAMAVYGFSRIELPFFDLVEKFGDINTPVDFTIERDELISFCNLCTSSVDSKSIPHATLKVGLGRIILSLADTDLSIESKINLQGNSETFKFNPFLMKTLLECLTDKYINFHSGSNRYYITDAAKNYTSVIMATL